DEKKCVDNGVATCIDPNNDGCTVWDTPAACKDNQSCDGAKCIDKCTSDCTNEGATESTWTTLRTCKKTAEGCLKWENTLACKKGEKITDGKCVKVCGTNCDTFSIVLLPDTQYYTRKVNADGTKKTIDGYPNPNVFADQLLWISDKRQEKNIKAVIHLGDVTDTNDKSAWKLANKAYKKYLDTDANKDLPYIVGPGNHDFKQCESNDVSVSTCTYARKSNFAKTDGGNFNADRFKGRKWFGEFYKTTNSYITFNAGGIDFLVIALEYAPRKEAINWANKLIKDKEAERKAAGKPGYKVIIESHAYISPGASKKTPNPDANGYYQNGYSTISADVVKALGDNALSGKEMYEQLTSRHNNIILVVNGHHSGSFFRLNKGKAGNVFGELVVDYQSENGYLKLHGKDSECTHSHYNGGAGMGFLRVLHFNPDNVTITAKTHSTLGKARFKNETKIAFCSKDSKGNYNNKKDSEGEQKDYYPENYSSKPDYNIMADGTHASTNFHSFTVTGLDFVTPVEYKYTE
ncbi:MAG: metallophosphoesterase, partial [Proteobacteria bacterium]|nr:metallophosphoesterase [Pseudomonadota bacterium]